MAQNQETPMSSGLHSANEPRLLSAVFASAMDAILVIDAEQRIVLFNPAAIALFGCASEQAIGSPLSRFLPSRFHAVHQSEVGHFLQTGDTARAMGHLQNLTALRADGTEFPIEATIAQVEIDGAVFGLAIVRDITARVKVETQLLRQAEQLDLAYDAIFTWAWDGPILTWNRGAERLYGYSAEEAIGRFSHELLNTAHADGFAEMRQELERYGTWEGELRHVGRDGRELLVDSRHVLVRDGGAPYVLEVNRDVTERKRLDAARSAAAAQAAAAAAEAAANALERDRLRDILEGFPGGVEILGRRGDQIEFSNSGLIELIFGHRGFPTGILPTYGRDFSFCRADGTPLPGPERPGQRALRGERVHNQQLELVRVDGSRLSVAAHAAPLRSHIGEVTNAIVVIQDVTLVRQAEQVKD